MFIERWPDQRRVKTAFILLNIMFIAWVTNH